MSSSTLSRNINQNYLPDDIFIYNNERFYDYIKQSYGDDLAGLLSFQAIRNGNDKYEIKLAVKLAINSLIYLLKIKQEEQNKRKRRASTKYTSSNVDTLKSVDQIRSQNEMTVPPTIAASPVSDASSTQSALQLIQNRLNDIGHITDIEQRINKWWSAYKNNNDLFLSKGTHYLLEINKSINDTYACVLSWKYRTRFKLPFMETGFFKLSAYYRHLKEKQCLTKSTA
ncbi:unnamed protein product, partial [Rotaria magnacalcarata]